MMSCSRSRKTPRRMRFSVRSRKKRSTMLSHEAEVGVKCTWKRLCLASQRWTRAMLVRGVVIADDVDLHFRRHGLIDEAQKLQPLLMPVALLAQAIDLAVGGVERGKQRGRSVAFVIVRHGLAAALLHRQTGLGAIQRLYLALLIDAKHQCMLGRIEIEADDIFQFGGELGIVADLEALHAMRLETWARQMRPTLDSEMPASRAMVRATSAWRLPECSAWSFRSSKPWRSTPSDRAEAHLSKDLRCPVR